MSTKKLKAAMQTGTVTIRSKSAGEVSVWYVDRANQRQQIVIGPFQTREMAPRLTEPERLRYSNIEDLVRLDAVVVL